MTFFLLTDCRPCEGANTYMYKACTATTDRVCRTCKTCARGTYVQARCQGFQDTACAGILAFYS